jgi:hypothetical protein
MKGCKVGPAESCAHRGIDTSRNQNKDLLVSNRLPDLIERGLWQDLSISEMWIRL